MNRGRRGRPPLHLSPPQCHSVCDPAQQQQQQQQVVERCAAGGSGWLDKRTVAVPDEQCGALRGCWCAAVREGRGRSGAYTLALTITTTPRALVAHTNTHAAAAATWNARMRAFHAFTSAFDDVK